MMLGQIVWFNEVGQSKRLSLSKTSASELYVWGNNHSVIQATHWLHCPRVAGYACGGIETRSAWIAPAIVCRPIMSPYMSYASIFPQKHGQKLGQGCKLKPSTQLPESEYHPRAWRTPLHGLQARHYASNFRQVHYTRCTPISIFPSSLFNTYCFTCKYKKCKYQVL